MRAQVIDRHGDPGGLRIADLDPPAVGDGEVLVRVQGAALNPADRKVMTGRDGGKFLHASAFPLILGFDFSGTVEKVGPGVEGVDQGDDVFGFLPYSRKNRQGSFAEYVSVPAPTVARKPAGVSHIEAASAATAASTALQALRDKGRLQSGQRVLINGASGGVGSYAVQIAKAMGAGVFGICSAAKSDYVAKLGADEVIDYREKAIGDLEQTFDVILDAASVSSFGACRGRLSPGGTYVTLLPSPGLLAGFLGSLFTGKRLRFVVVKSRRDDLAQIGSWMASESWIHPIDSTFPFEKLGDALGHLDSGKVNGKIALEIDPDSTEAR